MPTILERARRAWDVFRNRNPRDSETYYGSGSYFWPNRHRFSRGNERTIMAPILNRIAVDAASITIKHVMTDDQHRYKTDVNDGLNDIFNLEANIDQSGRAFLQDLYSSILDEGFVAVIPVDGECNFEMNSILDVTNARVCKIVQWYPQSVDVDIYNEMTGRHETIRFPKRMCAIIQNPFYAIMNEPNSVAQRLKRKMLLLDEFDERSVSGKLDIIIQLPYGTRSQTRMKQAEMRRHDLEVQLAGSKYGVAYADANEKIIQLNRSLENNLVPQIDALTKQLYGQLGFGEEILNGTANEQQKLNYINDIIEPLVSAVVVEFRRSFLTKNARSRGEDIMFFRDPFRLVPVNNIADIADKFTRNEIMSSNEVRSVVGLKPSEQPGADELRNKNLNQSAEAEAAEIGTNGEQSPEEGGPGWLDEL